LTPTNFGECFVDDPNGLGDHDQVGRGTFLNSFSHQVVFLPWGLLRRLSTLCSMMMDTHVRRNIVL
jgi:hypothetical protein